MQVPNPASLRAATRTWRWPSVLACIAIIGLLAGLVVVPASHGAEDDLQLYPLASSNFGRVLRVSGIANPGQAVRIEANGQIVARTVANESGDFAVAFTPVRGMNTVQAVEDGRFYPARSAAFRVRQDMPRILERPVAVSNPATVSGAGARNIVMKVTLAAPVITTPPATTTANPITLSGTAPASSTVNFYVNGRYTRAVTATAGGTFSTWVPLEDSLNSVYAVATSGPDTSPASNTVQTTYTNSIARTYATGTISVPTVWTAGSAPTYTINGTQTISNTGALWIQPGVTVSVTGNYKLSTDGGEIAIRGTSTARVTLRPSTALCTGTSAQRNDWLGIEAKNSAGNGTVSTEYADVYCAANGVFFNGGTGSIRYSKFFNGGNGVQTKGSGTSSIIVPLISGDNEFRGNSSGILVSINSRPTISGNNLVTGNYNGIRVSGSSTAAEAPLPVINGNSIYANSSKNLYTENFSSNTTVILDAKNNWWGSSDPGTIAGTFYDHKNAPSSPYVDFSGFLDGAGGTAAYTGNTLVGPVATTSTLAAGDYLMLSDVSVPSGVTWTLSSGATIRSVPARSIIVSGSLQVAGSSSQRVEFTSAKEGRAKDDWGGIEVASGGTATLNYARVEYASKGVFFNGGQGAVTHSLIRFCTHGIYVGARSNPTVNQGNEISNNQYGIYVYGDSTLVNNPNPVVNGNSLFGNSSYNYYSYGFGAPKPTLDAVGNWWGSAVQANILATIRANYTSSAPVDSSGYLTAEPFQPAINLTNFALSVREVRPIVSTTPASGTFTLNRGGTVTFQIKRDSDGVIVRQWSQSFVAGSNAFSWDGRNDAAQLIPQGAYRAVLTATDGVDPFVYDAPVPAVVVGNTGGVGSPPATFNPYTGEQYKLNVTFQSPTLASLLITPQSGTPFYVFQKVYYPAGSNWIYWDGRDPNGVLLTVPATVWVDDGQIMRTNGIYVFSPVVQITGTTAAPNIEVRSDPYLITSSYEQNAKIVYRISLDATVRVTLLPPGIVDPASPSAIVLANNVAQTAKDGSNVPIDHIVEWRGYNTADPNAVLVSADGSYTFAIEATLPATGQKTLYRGVLGIAQ